MTLIGGNMNSGFLKIFVSMSAVLVFCDICSASEGDDFKIFLSPYDTQVTADRANEKGVVTLVPGEHDYDGRRLTGFVDLIKGQKPLESISFDAPQEKWDARKQAIDERKQEIKSAIMSMDCKDNLFLQQRFFKRIHEYVNCDNAFSENSHWEKRCNMILDKHNLEGLEKEKAKQLLEKIRMKLDYISLRFSISDNEGSFVDYMVKKIQSEIEDATFRYKTESGEWRDLFDTPEEKEQFISENLSLYFHELVSNCIDDIFKSDLGERRLYVTGSLTPDDELVLYALATEKKADLVFVDNEGVHKFSYRQHSEDETIGDTIYAILKLESGTFEHFYRLYPEKK